MSTRLSAGRVPAIYGFIKAHQHQFSVEMMCRLLEVTRSGYYEWLKEPSVEAGTGGRQVAAADQLRGKFPKLAELIDGAETDVLAFMTFPKAHRTQIHSTNPLERLNAEIKRRTDVVGIFPNEAVITRLVGALLLEQNDEWQLQRRYMSLEALRTLSDNQPARLSAVVR